MLSLNILVNDIPAEGEVRKVVKLMKPDDIFLLYQNQEKVNLYVIL